jgi:hypothetical protein
MKFNDGEVCDIVQQVRSWCNSDPSIMPAIVVACTKGIEDGNTELRKRCADWETVALSAVAKKLSSNEKTFILKTVDKLRTKAVFNWDWLFTDKEWSMEDIGQ